MSGLYFQPAPSRINDDSLPTAPDRGQDVTAIIDELTHRVNQATRKIEHMVDSRALAKIILTDRDIVLMGDQVSIVGQLNIVDWVRDLSGNPTGGIDRASMTRITGGKVQTGVIESFNWSVMAGSQFDLDNGTIVTGGSVAPKFSVNSSGQLTCQDATVRGTITAGSFIQSSVQLDDEFGPTLADIAAGSDIQAALDAGVTNILAGVGSNFRLDVNVADALVTFRHKDAVFFGTASAGSVKPALGITSSGIGMGYNRASDGAWQTSIAIDASGNVTLTGTLTAGSIITGSVTVSGVSLTTILNNAQDGADIADDLKISGTTVLKGVLVPTDAGAIKTGSITWSATTGALTGGTGMAITEFGIIGAAAGSATMTFVAATGALTIKGDLTGGSNINITGIGTFGGAQTLNSFNAAIHANPLAVADVGIYCRDGSSTGAAIQASGITSGADGVSCQAVGSGGRAIYALAVSSAKAGVFDGTVDVNGTLNASAFALSGAMTMTNTTRVANLNADMVDGIHAAAMCQGSNTNSGLCTVSGNVMNIQVSGGLLTTVRTRASANAVLLENVSDRNKKKDILDEVLGLDFIERLRPRSFRMKAYPTLQAHGLIYQEVLEILGCEGDSLACLNTDGTGSVDYNGIVSPIIKAIQELSKKVNSLELKQNGTRH